MIKHHSEFFEVYKAFCTLVKTQHSVVIKCFRNGRGGKYTSNKFLKLPSSDGTIQKTSCTDTSKQISVAKRKHRDIIETSRFFLMSAYVLSEF